MDDRQADSYMLADIEGSAFEAGTKHGKSVIIEEIINLLNEPIVSEGNSAEIVDYFRKKLRIICKL